MFYLYIAKHKNRDIMKIGVSGNPIKRLKDINEKFDIVASSCYFGDMDTIYAVEQAILSVFHSHMVSSSTVCPGGHTEWLNSSILDKVITFINTNFKLGSATSLNRIKDKIIIGNFKGLSGDKWEVFVEGGKLMLSGSDVGWEAKCFNEKYWNLLDTLAEKYAGQSNVSINEQQIRELLFNDWVPYMLSIEELDALLNLLRNNGFPTLVSRYIPIFNLRAYFVGKTK